MWIISMKNELILNKIIIIQKFKIQKITKNYVFIETKITFKTI